MEPTNPPTEELLTTRQKVDMLIDAVRTTPKAEQTGELAELVELLEIATGLFGRDPLELLLPKSDAEYDLFVDKVIALLFACRGDDLPPFDLDQVELGG